MKLGTQKLYKATVKNEDGKIITITSSYFTKEEFAQDLKRNGYRYANTRNIRLADKQ